MSDRAYDAILLDLDGTLVDERDQIHPHTFACLRAAVERGVRVMIATGRSELATIPVLDRLGFDTPAVVYNGAGIWCPVQRRMLEERVLSDRTLTRALDFGERHGHMTVTMCIGVKYATKPRTAPEQSALHDMTGLVVADRATMLAHRAIRATLFSDHHATSGEFADELEAAIAAPVYITHFPLSALPHHRDSKLLVCDVQPPCKGKAEGLRVLRELYGIEPERVVAVGDASNDVPMFEAAGLAVAMQDSMSEAFAVADRVIGANSTGTIGDLVSELFLG
jgi:Cof subfamily protein (haloacid dehalogenase superfamily)